jgi:putative flippase GtrA
MKDKICQWYKAHRSFVIYFLISVFVTLVDIVVSRVSERFVDVVIANTIGVVTGFVIQYFLCTKKVYAGSSVKTAVIFFITWLFGLGLANLIVYLVRVQLFDNREGLIYYLIGKGASIAIPFFITYFIRKKLIPAKKD